MREDETRGNSKLDPREYKGDSLVQAWVDRRELATLSLWLDGAGWRTRTVSDILKFTIKAVVINLVENGIVEKIELTADADLIMRKYKANLNPQGRGLKNLSHNLILDDRRGKQFEDNDSLVERIRRKTEEDMKRLEDISGGRNLEDIIREQKEIALKDPRVVDEEVKDDTPEVDVERNLAKAKENDDKLKDMP